MSRRCALIIIFILIIMDTSGVKAKYRRPMINYPKDTLFWATDFFVKGCKNFIQNCPASYKNQEICARSYNGEYRNFANYCEMQYENCNTWRTVRRSKKTE